MKILHTSDWHLGKRLGRYYRLEEQKIILREIIQICDSENPDAVLIAGDIFDNPTPANDAMELLYDTLKKISNQGNRAVIVIAGNHDSPDKIEVPDAFARECGIVFSGYPNTKTVPFKLNSGMELLKSEEGFIELKLPASCNLRVIITPYANELRLKQYLGDENSQQELSNQLAEKWHSLAEKYCDSEAVNVLISHQFIMKRGGEEPEESDDERSIKVGGLENLYTDIIPKQIQYAAFGHIHKPWVISEEPVPVIYSGSPLIYSLNESNQSKYVFLADIEPGKPAEYKKIPLQNVRNVKRKIFASHDDALEWLTENPETYIEMHIETEEYLETDKIKEYYNIHNGILNVIPHVKNTESETADSRDIILEKSTEELFSDYFKYKHGIEPSDYLLELFREISAAEEL